MNFSEDTVVGSAKSLKPEKLYKLSPVQFPSKIGKSPVWLIPENLPVFRCDLCQGQMTFILQVYCPLEYDHSYHRTLYLFACANKSCEHSSKSIKVLRAQLPVANGYYPEDFESEQDKRECVKSEITGEWKELKSEFLIKTEIYSGEETRFLYNKAQEAAQKKDEESDDESMEGYEDPTNDPEMKKLDEIYKKFKEEKEENKNLEDQKEVDRQLDDMYADMNKKDMNFLVYREVVTQSQGEVLRYCRSKDTEPLWFSDKKTWKKEDLPACSSCGGKLTFEFQMQSSLLNIIPELLDVNWGIIAVYTCEKSCDRGGYVEELALRQLGDIEDEQLSMELANLNIKLHIEKENVTDSENEENEEIQETSKSATVTTSKETVQKAKKKKKAARMEPKEVVEEDSDWE